MRNVFSSWLNGVDIPDSSTRYPGSDLGLPRSGRGSCASSIRRASALTIDWLACYSLSLLLWGTNPSLFIQVLGLWSCICVCFVVCANCTPGQALVGITIIRVDNSSQVKIGLLRAVIRQLCLIPLLIPAFFMDYDGRGWQDRITGTAVVRT